jgi:DNA-binding NtrC family response regulator
VMEAITAITRRVLVASRDAGIGRAIAEATQPWMFETVTCATVQGLSDLLQRKEFALIFCEENYEDGTYQDLLSAVRSHKVPVVLMMANVDQDDVFREAMASGAFGVIGNSCSRRDVQWMVVQAVQKESLGRCRFQFTEHN